MKNIFLIFSIITLLSQPLLGLNIFTPHYQNMSLYQQTPPYREGYIQVSDLHRLYYSEFGNPKGTPVVVLHGGPGGGSYPSWSAYFNPTAYHVIMFDQRGAGRSTPFAEMRDNTPQASIEDMEKLRVFLGIDKWYIFGGSWGSTLALLYAEEHPERVEGMVLRSIFLARKQDYSHLFYGMRTTYPEAWDEMVATIGANENTDLITALDKQVMNPDPNIHLKAAHAFMLFDTLCAFLIPNQAALNEIVHDDKQALSVGRAFIHYSANNFYLEENQILNNIQKIAHIPTIIVHGRYDIICPMIEAYTLHKQMTNSELWIIPDAGHASSEPSISKALQMSMDHIRLKARL